MSLKLSPSRRPDAWRPREGRRPSRYCIARTRSGAVSRYLHRDALRDARRRGPAGRSDGV